MSGKQNKEITDAILDAIAQNSCVTTQQVADLIKTTLPIAAGRLTYLRKQGKIVGKSGKWAFRVEHLKGKPKEHMINQALNDLGDIFYNIIKMGLPNEETQHS